VTPNSTVAEEPKIPAKMNAPTEDAEVPAQPKHNCSETFDCPPFVGTVKQPAMPRNGRPMLDANNKPVIEEKVTMEGTANPDFYGSTN